MITVYIGPTIVDFVVGDIVRQGFGFANPNHAAASICALFQTRRGTLLHRRVG